MRKGAAAATRAAGSPAANRPTRRGLQPWQPVALLSFIIAAYAAREAWSTLHPPRHARIAAVAGNARPRPVVAHEDTSLPAKRALGKKLFFDTSLSVPAGTSCASCHDPSRAFAGNHGSKLGVPRGSRPDHYARRNTPSLLYLKFVHRFHYHWEEDAALPDAYGGFFWDGRSDSLAALAEQPLTNPDEMNAGSHADVARKLRALAYADELRRLFGADALDTPERALAVFGQAIEAYLLGDEMAPFSSRYDDFVRGRATLTPLEQRGLALFSEPAKGNCAFCHRLNAGVPDPARSLFTDFGYETVAVPRNRRMPADDRTQSFDLGLCERNDARNHTDEARFCGSFRTPSLRNVATREAFMHNGAFTRLRDVVAFYATRSTHPERWYSGRKYDDLPPQYVENVNELMVPYDRGIGETARLDDSDIDAIVAFLNTLTDAEYREPSVAATTSAPDKPHIDTPANETELARDRTPHVLIDAPDPSVPHIHYDVRTLANEPSFQNQ